MDRIASPCLSTAERIHTEGPCDPCSRYSSVTYMRPEKSVRSSTSVGSLPFVRHAVAFRQSYLRSRRHTLSTESDDERRSKVYHDALRRQDPRAALCDRRRARHRRGMRFGSCREVDVPGATLEQKLERAKVRRRRCRASIPSAKLPFRATLTPGQTPPLSLLTAKRTR